MCFLFMKELKTISSLYTYNRTVNGSEKGNTMDTKDVWLHVGQLHSYTGEKLVGGSQTRRNCLQLRPSLSQLQHGGMNHMHLPVLTVSK